MNRHMTCDVSIHGKQGVYCFALVLEQLHDDLTYLYRANIIMLLDSNSDRCQELTPQ